VSSNLSALTARRIALQAQCAAQRQELSRVHGDIERGVAPIDRAVETLRAFLPVLAIAGIAGLIIVGPGRTLALVRRGLSVATTAVQAVQLLRSFRP
jgi:hypothetical protein